MINLPNSIQTALDSLKTESTRVSYSLWMLRFEEWFTLQPKKHITYDLIIRYMASLKDDYNKPSRALALAAVKCLCKNIHLSDNEEIDIYAWLTINNISPERIESLPSGQMIPIEDFKLLLATCMSDRSPAGARDAAIFSTLYSTGMRRDECAKLRMTDYNQQEGKFIIKQTKGKQDRVAYLDPSATEYLKQWLRLRGSEPDYIFWRIKRGGDLWPGKPITGSGIRKILMDRCAEAGIKFYRPHDFRRTLISNLLDKNDAILVAKIAGHKNVATTMRYDVRDDKRIRAAMASVYEPY